VLKTSLARLFNLSVPTAKYGKMGIKTRVSELRTRIKKGGAHQTSYRMGCRSVWERR
jgi:hypothetical protein